LRSIRKGAYFIPELLIFIAVLFAKRNTIFTGFDFTDATLNYHFSIQVLNGQIPFKDFFSAVMPSAYYVESFFHFVFGDSYRVNKLLGLVNEYLVYLAYYKIIGCFLRKYTALIFTGLLVSVSSIGVPVYFNFAPFVGCISLWLTYIMLSKRINNRCRFILAGVLSGLIFTTKQSYLLGAVGLSITSILLLGETTYIKFKSLLRYSLSFSFISVLVFVPTIIEGGTSSLFYALTTGSRKKGLLTIGDVVSTAHGLPGSKVIFFSFFVVITVFILYLYLPGKLYILFIPFTLSLLELSIALDLKFFPLYEYYDEMSINIMYDIPRLFSVLYIIYAVCNYEFNTLPIIATVSVACFTTVAQLGWPGRPYVRPALSSYFVFLIPSIIKLKLDNHNTFRPNNWKYLKGLNICTLSILCGFLLSIFFVDTMSPKWENRRDYSAKKKVTLEPYLNEWKMSESHADFIEQLNAIKDARCSKDDTMFVFPWAPVLYTLMEMENPTIHDLAYHDWITKRQGENVIQSINKKLPCLIVITGSFVGNSESPFPAKGMKLINKEINTIIGKNYKEVLTKDVFVGQYIIFVKK